MEETKYVVLKLKNFSKERIKNSNNFCINVHIFKFIENIQNGTNFVTNGWYVYGLSNYCIRKPLANVTYAHYVKIMWIFSKLHKSQMSESLLSLKRCCP